MSFTQLLTCKKTATFINPSNPGQTFTVNPSSTVTRQITQTTTQDLAVTLPAWLCAADANGNPTHPLLKLMVSEGSATVA